MEMQDREAYVFIAKLAEQAERYEEMVEIMKKVAQLNQELTVEERNLLSVGYKNVIGARRASWRIMSSVLLEEESKGNERLVKLIKGNLQKVEEELTVICNDLLALIEAHLIPSSKSTESFVFYYKMKGDYYRYLAEFKTGNERKAVAEQAMEAYKTATQKARTLPATHPIKLGLALNFSVFYYEIVGALHRACYLAQQAFDEAIAHLRNVSGECYMDSTLVLRLLRDNLILWTTDVTDKEDDDDGVDDTACDCITSAGHQQ